LEKLVNFDPYKFVWQNWDIFTALIFE
jgi:hypothetical protein